MSYVYKTKGTCSTKIEVELEGNIVRNVVFTGGCHGNLQAIPKLVEGMTVEEVE
ncbi:MAG: TIGR03905 family TSCPD domain-containing protein, partial [Agathobacter sp.]|nr:TIGR03905 family TSCPD domain-containing protein [Agathobacter sp.]